MLPKYIKTDPPLTFPSITLLLVTQNFERWSSSRVIEAKVQRLSQLLKGAVVVTLCQNEAEVKCQMDIDCHISLTEQAGKFWRSMSMEIFSSASFWRSIVPTAPL